MTRRSGYPASELSPWSLIQQLVIVSAVGMLGNASKESRQAEGIYPYDASESAMDFCRWEFFNVTCASDGVILIKSAFYGRMRKGRCTEMEYYIGCAKDVLLWVDDRCSGQRHCVIAVPDPNLHEIQPCPKDLQTYLEVDYECIAVQVRGRMEGEALDDRNDGCHQERPVDRIPGYLSSSVADTTSLGSVTCPWLVAASKGQRIALTLIDFSVLNSNASDDTLCHMYAIIQEKGQRDETVCAGRERTRKLYTSLSNELQIVIIKQRNDRHRKKFLIRYEASGCPDPHPSPSTWIDKHGDRLTVGCNCSSQTWHLVCNGTEWTGIFSDCPPCEGSHQSEGIYPYGLLLSIVIGIVLGIVLGVCLLAVLLACRRSRPTSDQIQTYVERREAEKQTIFGETSLPGREWTGYSGFVNHSHPSIDAHGSTSQFRFSSYAHILDLNRHRGADPPTSKGNGTAQRTVTMAPPGRSPASPGDRSRTGPFTPAAAALATFPCCGPSATRTDQTLGRRCQAEALDHDRQESITSYSDGPDYNEVATPD